MPLFKMGRDVDREEFKGPSFPVIQTPTGRLLRLQEFDNGYWLSCNRNEQDCKVIVEALNFILENSPEIIADWKETD